MQELCQNRLAFVYRTIRPEEVVLRLRPVAAHRKSCHTGNTVSFTTEPGDSLMASRGHERNRLIAARIAKVSKSEKILPVRKTNGSTTHGSIRPVPRGD